MALVATVGPRGSALKVSRKAIQEVNVKKACETILQPGAPLALRVQGNLLYGVSRVFAQQCIYVLGDAAKIRTDMQMFYRLLAQNATDPTAGQVDRGQILLEDDPSFVLDPVIPAFDFNGGGDIVSQPDQASSNKEYSQFSLVNNCSVASKRAGSAMSFNLSQSDGSSLHLVSPFRINSSAKKNTLEERIAPLEEENDLEGLGDIMFDIDDEGNIVGIADPIEELRLPGLVADPAHLEQGVGDEMIIDEQGLPILGGDNPPQPHLSGDDVFMLDGEQGPDAQDIQQQHVSQAAQLGHQQQVTNAATSRKKRTTRARKFLDLRTLVSRLEQKKDWDSYLQRMAEEREKTCMKIDVFKARANAYAVSFGQGLNGIGRCSVDPNYVHPLAHLFAGDGLRDLVFGVRNYNAEVPSPAPSEVEVNRRRSASQAFDDELGEHEDGRRVRPRLGAGAPEPGQDHLDMDMDIVFGDDNNLPPEMGMKEQEQLEDHMSSSIMPWNRTPSVHRPASVIDFGSKQYSAGSRQVTISPKGSIQPIERHSDVGHDHRGSDLGFARGPSMDSSFEEFGAAAGINTQEADSSQWMRGTLDAVSKDFLQYAVAQAKKTGRAIDRDGKGPQRWVEFEELARPGEHTKIVAARAFYHVLTLGTKNLIALQQEGQDTKPFGIIRMGVQVDDSEVDDDAFEGADMRESISENDDDSVGSNEHDA
ncbi:hypothetical protein ACHAQH_007152 [Verticillium albo-atrum]